MVHFPTKQTDTAFFGLNFAIHRYTDEEGDRVEVLDDNDLREAIRLNGEAHTRQSPVYLKVDESFKVKTGRDDFPNRRKPFPSSSFAANVRAAHWE